MNAPGYPAGVVRSMTRHQSANGTRMTSAPNAVDGIGLCRGRVVGDDDRARIASSRAHQATPWAMFPALAVQTPSRNASDDQPPHRVPCTAQS